jgi:post-segregation antitoxin (ccd killing protein)
VVELLRERDYVRRNDVFDNAKALGLDISDSLYNRVMKELCGSNGNQWRLKTGVET